MRHFRDSAVIACLLVMLATPARAVSLARARTASSVDWVSAGIGGIPGDTAHVTVAGVTGAVTKAYLYWGGVANLLATSFYDNGTIAIDGHQVTGTSSAIPRRTAGDRARAGSTSPTSLPT